MRKFLRNRSWVVRAIILLIIPATVIPAVYIFSAAVGSADSGAVAKDSLPADSLGRIVDNVAFGVGEKLSYDINYGFINAGTATMEVAKMIEFRGRPCYQIVTHANSNSFFSSFYRVEDRVESILDAAGLYSWQFEKNLREGKYRADRKYAFDQKKHLVYYESDTIPVEPFAQDALSVLFYVRTQSLEVGKSIFVDNFVDGKKYKVEVRVLKKEHINVSAGSFDCFVVEPLTSDVGVFKSNGTLTVWLTDDRMRLPVLMKSKIMIGSVSAELTDFKLGEIQDL
ncbi:MAG TPA: DUF3108 domain-containing protein [Candidatus Acidoferrum sp.]|nr:DUF3108 domain-containing protein [Candidatus Acidoferrum sp.]